MITTFKETQLNSNKEHGLFLFRQPLFRCIVPLHEINKPKCSSIFENRISRVCSSIFDRNFLFF